MEKIVELAMDRVRWWWERKDLWWDDPLVNAVLDEAVKLGWVYRSSHTQVEWTEKGVEAVHALRPKVKFLVEMKDRSVVVSVGDEGILINKERHINLVKDKKRGRIWLCEDDEIEVIEEGK